MQVSIIIGQYLASTALSVKIQNTDVVEKHNLLFSFYIKKEIVYQSLATKLFSKAAVYVQKL